MKILYTSCFHPVLEYDHCVLFEEMGHDWFSTGIYLDPKNPLNIPSLRIRKSIDREPCPALKSYFLGSNPKYYQGFQGLNRPMVVLNHRDRKSVV